MLLRGAAAFFRSELISIFGIFGAEFSAFVGFSGYTLLYVLFSQLFARPAKFRIFLNQHGAAAFDKCAVPPASLASVLFTFMSSAFLAGGHRDRPSVSLRP
jgi:hypothetical protein